MGSLLSMNSGAGNRDLRVAPDLRETVSVTGLGFEVSVCKTGSGQGVSASLFRQRQHRRGFYVGQRQQDSRRTSVAELYLLYHSRAGRESNLGLVRLFGHTVLWPGLLGTFFFETGLLSQSPGKRLAEEAMHTPPPPTPCGSNSPVGTLNEPAPPP